MTAKKTKVAKSGDSITVSWNSKIGTQTRIYSEALHGKDFKKLAAEFIEKHKGTIVE